MKEKRIDLKSINLDQSTLKTLDNQQPVFIMDGINEKYVMIEANEYEFLTGSAGMYNSQYYNRVTVVTPEGFDLTGDDMEELKEMLIKTLEKELDKNKKQ